MVAFSRFAFTLAIAGLSCAQSFSGPPGPPPSGFPSRLPHTGTASFSHHPHPTGPPPSGIRSHKGPRPSDAPSGVIGAERAFDSGAELPLPSGTGFPSGFPHPTGPHPTGPRPSGLPSGISKHPRPSGTLSGLAERALESGADFPSGTALPSHHPHHTGPHPTGPPPSGFPSGGPHSRISKGPRPSDAPSGVVAAELADGAFPTDFPSGFPTDFPSGFPTAFPSGTFPSGGRHGGHSGSLRPTGPAPTGPRPSGGPHGAKPSGFATSIRNAV